RVKALSPACYMGVIMVGMLIFITLLASQGFSDINSRRPVLEDLYQLRCDIQNANHALLRSAVAPTQHESETELSAMLLTRESANRIYDRLLTQHQITLSERRLIETMKTERDAYRKAQLQVVDDIRNAKPRTEMWAHYRYYRVLQEQYTGRVNVLLRSVSEDCKQAFVDTRLMVWVACMTAILIVAGVVYRTVRS
ncbi:MAG: hypothetical protein ACRCWC_03835, partial [Plesiomonas shigelloides]